MILMCVAEKSKFKYLLVFKNGNFKVLAVLAYFFVSLLGKMQLKLSGFLEEMSDIKETYLPMSTLMQ
jgi:hypothetical protein